MRHALQIAVLSAGLAGCGNDLGPGFGWKVDVASASDTCHNPPISYNGPQTFDYVLRYDGAAVTLYLDDEPFGHGFIGGCDVSYSSVVWKETDDAGYEVSWQLIGDATFRPGGDTCNLDQGVDWLGTEIFEIVGSEDPDVEPGCTYELEMSGAYTGEVD